MDGRRRAYALHVSATLPSGEVHTRPGPLMAAADVLRVRVTGRGGHASAPHDALDPVPAAAAMVGALQTALTRRVDAQHAAVLTIAKIVAGTTNNVIPESAVMEGTLRTLSEPVRTLLHDEIRRVCRHTALAYGCSAAVEIEPGYPVTVNDEAAARRVGEVAGARAGPQPRGGDAGADHGRGGLLVRAAEGARRAGVPRCLPAAGRPGDGPAEPQQPGGVRRVGHAGGRGAVRGAGGGRAAAVADRAE